MDGSHANSSTKLRKIVEEYTPDGTVGRLLLAATSGALGMFAFWIFVVWAFGIPGLFWLVLSVVPGAIAIGTAALALLVLWPVYLSLIGKIDSPSEYGTNRVEAKADGEDPVAILKREYARGNVSGEEFERRLDTLLGTESVTKHNREQQPDSDRMTDLAVEEELEKFDRA